MDGILGFILAGLVLAGSPGPATLSLAATGAAFGTRPGLPYLMGLVVGMVLVMAIVATGASAVVLAMPGIAPAVTLAAAVYFLYLAWRIATAPPIAAASRVAGAPVTAARRQERLPGFRGGVLLSLFNPKGYAAMAALFSGFVLIPGRFDLDAALKTAVLTGIIGAVNIAWLGAGAALTRFFRDPRTSRKLNLGFAVLLIASVAAAMLL
ncbi:MAG TPA: LysE family translocator [Dongiaceae bacterium]|nr:LysE family translocator [Dongiaceae bacterium]